MYLYSDEQEQYNIARNILGQRKFFCGRVHANGNYIGQNSVVNDLRMYDALDNHIDLHTPNSYKLKLLLIQNDGFTEQALKLIVKKTKLELVLYKKYLKDYFIGDAVMICPRIIDEQFEFVAINLTHPNGSDKIVLRSLFPIELNAERLTLVIESRKEKKQAALFYKNPKYILDKSYVIDKYGKENHLFTSFDILSNTKLRFRISKNDFRLYIVADEKDIAFWTINELKEVINNKCPSLQCYSAKQNKHKSLRVFNVYDFLDLIENEAIIGDLTLKFDGKKFTRNDFVFRIKNKAIEKYMG